jgi:GAF domain-containing protein
MAGHRPGVGACGTATALGVEVISADIASDPAWAPFRDLVLPFGIRACWSRPIMAGPGKPVGAFAFYYREPRGPSALERVLVDRSIALCAIALDRERRVEERDRRANTDGLTGLPNRSAFNAALAQVDCSHPGNWALFLIDLDGFKAINDTYGHPAGDALLVQVGRRLADQARPTPSSASAETNLPCWCRMIALARHRCPGRTHAGNPAPSGQRAWPCVAPRWHDGHGDLFRR